MNYNEFKQELEEKLIEKLEKEYNDVSIILAKTQIINGQLDSMIIQINGYQAVPRINIGQMYDRYNDISRTMEQKKMTENPMDMLVDEVYVSFREAVEKLPDISNQYENISKNLPDNVVLQLVNTEKNREMLGNVPHREIEDLSVIYRWILEKVDKGRYSAIVTWDMADEVGMGEEELYRHACENTKRLLPAEIKSMAEVMVEMMINDVVASTPEEIMGTLEAENIENIKERLMEEETELMHTPYPMYVITNEEHYYGAVQMLFNENLDKISEIFQDDLYILPSSIQEVIAVSAKDCDITELKEMVEWANSEVVELEEQLSDQVYFYDSRERKLSIATDTPNKKLDTDGTSRDETDRGMR